MSESVPNWSLLSFIQQNDQSLFPIPLEPVKSHSESSNSSKSNSLDQSLPKTSKDSINNKKATNKDDNDEEDNDIGFETDSIESLSYFKSVISLSKKSIPISIGNFARLAMYNIDSIFLGHLGTSQLAGVSLCLILSDIVTMFVYSPAWSLNGLCSQAIGAGNPQLAGSWLQLALGICLLFTIPGSIVIWYLADIISIVENDSDVLHYARIFSHYEVIWLYFGAICMALRGYLQSIEIIAPLTIIPIITIIVDAAANYILIYGINVDWHINKHLHINYSWDGLGFIGSPLAQITAIIVQTILFYFWCFAWKKHHIKKNTWNGWSKKSFQWSRVKKFSKIMIPNMISDATENWAYQVSVLMCATLPTSNVAALSCLFDVWGVLWSFYSGFGACTITRIGKEMGKGNIKRAKFYTKISLISGAICSFILSTLCFVFSNLIGKLYSNDTEVIAIMDSGLKLLAFTYFSGSIGWTAMEVMEGMSVNKTRGFVVVSTAWFVYLPLALYFAFWSSFGKNCPVCWIFVAALIVELLRTIILWFILIYKINWEKQSMLAMIRAEIKAENIVNKLGVDIDYVMDEMKKVNSEDKEDNDKEGKNGGNGNNDDGVDDDYHDEEKVSVVSKVIGSNNIDGMEYVSLYDADVFSTNVEIIEFDKEKENSDKIDKAYKEIIDDKDNGIGLVNEKERKKLNELLLLKEKSKTKQLQLQAA